jgi:hypothetical protein
VKFRVVLKLGLVKEKTLLCFSRIEFDAYRNDLEFYATSPKTEVNMAKQKETEEMFQKQKLEFEKLRSDVQIKLKFLDENRVRQFSQVFYHCHIIYCRIDT